MTVRIRDILDLPERKPEVVIKVGELDDAERLRKNLADYVITPDIGRYLKRDVYSIADTLSTGLPRGYARWVEGAFGSGKSHYLTFLGALLRGVDAAWNKSSPAIEEMRDKQRIFKENRLLVVALNAQDAPNLRVGLYEKTNEALVAAGLEPVELFSYERVINSFVKKAEKVPGWWDYLFEQSSIVASREDFERLRESDPRLLAKEIAKIDERTGELERDFQLGEAEAIKRITEHLRANGYAGLVYLIDELTLHLLSYKENAAKSLLTLNRFIEAPNASLPVWLFVGRHQPLEDVLAKEGADTVQALDHLRGRFEQERVDLKDADLYEIIAQRVLRPKRGKEEDKERIVAGAISNIPADELKTLEGLYQERGRLKDWMTKLYPFHPAVIDALVSITHRLSRERTAISILYDMLLEPLDASEPALADQEASTFLPFGRAYDYLFNRDYTEMYQDATLKAAHRVIAEIVEERLKELNPESAKRTLLVAKTVVLGELTDRGARLKGKLDVPTIMALNTGGLSSSIPVLASREVEDALRFLVENTGVFRKTGKGTYEVALDIDVDPEAELRRIDVPNQETSRKEVIKEVLASAVGATSRLGHKEMAIDFRGTERRLRIQPRGEVEVDARTLSLDGNVEVSVYLLAPGAKLKKGDELASAVVAWLPAQLSPEGEKALDYVVKLRYVTSEVAKGVLDGYSKDTLDKLRFAWKTMLETQRERLLKSVVQALQSGRCYSRDPQIVETPPSNVERGPEELARRVLEGLYPKHPVFKSRVTSKALQTLLRALAEGSGEIRREDGEAYEIAENIGKPLEVVAFEGGRYIFRKGFFIQELIKNVSSGKIRTVQEARELLGERPFGLTTLVTDFLIRLLVYRGVLRIRRGNEVIVPEGKTYFDLKDKDFLEQGQLVNPEQWQLAHEYAKELGAKLEQVTLDLLAQDRAWKMIRKQIQDLNNKLSLLHGRVEEATRFYGLTPEEVGDPTLAARSALDRYRDLPGDSKEGIEVFVQEPPPKLELEKVEAAVDQLVSLLTNRSLQEAYRRVDQAKRSEAREKIRAMAASASLSEILDALRKLAPQQEPAPKPADEPIIGDSEVPPYRSGRSIELTVDKVMLGRLAEILGDASVSNLEPGDRITLIVKGRAE